MKSVIGCGMYAFNRALQSAWRALFEVVADKLPGIQNNYTIRFEDSHYLFNRDDMLIAQSCGYPYVTQYRKSHEPLCVGTYDIPGCKGTLYSSWLIKHKDDPRLKLTEFKTAKAAINNLDSNSGMNAFRHAVSEVANSKPFFEQILVSDSHLTSIEWVKSKKVEIAAIDAVTYYLAKKFDPTLEEIIVAFQQTQYTTGLPFLKSKSNAELEKGHFIESMNQALHEISNKDKTILSIKEFVGVSDACYDMVLQLESEANKRNYDTLM